MKKNKQIGLLSYQEEKLLTNKELINYYQELREYYTNKKINVRCESFRDEIHPELLNIMVKKMDKELVIVNKENLDGVGQVIYAVNHTNVHDVPAACNFIQNRFHILAGDEVKNDINGLLFRLNGVTWVDRNDPKDMARAKREVISKMLQFGMDYLIFPEGTWNLTENLPMLKMRWGIIDIAKITGAHIVLVTLDYSTNVYYANMGKPINYSIFDDKSEAIEILRSTMATLRMETWQKYSKDLRDNVSREAFQRDIIQASLDEYPKLDVEYEKKIIYKPKEIVDAEEVFNYPKPYLYKKF